MDSDKLNHRIIACTLGDPAGIGPELALKVCAAVEGEADTRLVIIGDRAPLEAAAEATGLPLPTRRVTAAELNLMDVSMARQMLAATAEPVLIEAGELNELIEVRKANAVGGTASFQYINLAIDWALAGIIDGVVTLPISKLALHLAGIDEPGHTEIFARRCKTNDYAMMLYSERLAVTLVTIHQSLASVAASINTDEICRVTRLADKMLARVRGQRPRLAILGLNPHAGESGLFGKEEESVIAPAVQRLKAEGYAVEGPLSPDAAFTPAAREQYDGHICMYHDQGLIPFKMVSVHDGVNVTLGLPIVRTSPDHGTAYDIVGRGQADPTSTLAAVQLAAQIAWANTK